MNRTTIEVMCSNGEYLIAEAQEHQENIVVLIGRSNGHGDWGRHVGSLCVKKTSDLADIGRILDALKRKL